MYWTEKDDIQIVCGCFRGDLDKFEEAVNTKYPTSKHGDDYRKQIKIMRYLIEEDI
jgi:hypothetical protein